MADHEERLAIVVYAQDLASRALKGVHKELSGLAGASKTVGKGLASTYGNLKMVGLAAGALAVGAGAAAVKWAGDFQSELNTINTIAFATPAQLDKIGDSIRGIAKKTGLSLDDLTSSYYDLLSAGVKTADAQALLNDAVTLGVGGLATTNEAVDLLTTAYNAYHLTAAQAAQATDMFAQAVADGKVKASEIASTFADVANLAKTYSVGIDQIAASYAFLTAQGVPAGEVTTQMQRAIISLIKPSGELDKAQKKLKLNFTDEISKKGLVPALQELRDYADKNHIPLIKLLGRVEAVKYALATTGPNEKGFLNELDRINGSTGEAAKQAAERQQGFNFQLSRMKALVKDAGITIGTALLPEMTDLVQQADDFLTGHQDDIKRFGTDLAGAFKDAVTWAKKLDWNAIKDDLKFAADAAKNLIGAFLNAPPWLQQAVVTGWGFNKISGGMLGDLAGGLGGGLLKGALGGSGGLLPVALGKAIPLALEVATIVALAGVLADQSKANAQGEADLGAQGNDFRSHASLDQLRTALAGLQAQDKSLNNGLSPEQIAYQMNIDGVRTALMAQIDALKAEIASRTGPNASGSPDDRDRTHLFTTLDKTADHADALAGSLTDLRVATAALASAAIKDADAILAHIGGYAGVGARARSKGYHPTQDQIARTWEKDLLHQAQLTADSNKTNAEKLAELRTFAASADAHGDRVVAAKIANMETTLDGDLKNLPSQIKLMLPGDTYGEGAHPLGPKPIGDPTPTDSGGNGKLDHSKGKAMGGLGHAWSPTDLGYYGEAGHEAVAIVRNPQRLLTGAGIRTLVANLAITLHANLKLDRAQAAEEIYRYRTTVTGVAGG